jgi:NAD(P)-dependent dehydrogenase (short-subunit alcohol dehydrogenase family)
VTGGACGIGAAVVERVRAAGGQALSLDVADGADIRCDVTDETCVVDAMARARTELGSITLGVLAAGVGSARPIVDRPVDEWDRVHGVNARGVFLTLRELARRMIADDAGGSIVVVTSISGFLADRTMSHYASSKAAANELVRVAARELGAKAIRVNAIAPGTTDTPMFAATDRLRGYREQVTARTPLGGVGDPYAVADAVLAISQLSWVTGQIVAADGGVSLFSPIDPQEPME